MYENNALYTGPAQMMATELNAPTAPCTLALERLSVLHEEAQALVNGLGLRLERVLRPTPPRGEGSKPMPPGESALHDALLQAAFRQESLIASLRELHQRITV